MSDSKVSSGPSIGGGPAQCAAFVWSPIAALHHLRNLNFTTSAGMSSVTLKPFVHETTSST